jgi:hypothetical protein
MDITTFQSELARRSLDKLDPYLQIAIFKIFVDYASKDQTGKIWALGCTVILPAGQKAAQIWATLEGWINASPGDRITSSHGAHFEETHKAYLTMDISLSTLLKFLDADFVSDIQMCANLAPNRPVPKPTAPLHKAALEAKPYRCTSTQIWGLIDHGCPFAHQAFLNGSKTRVWSIWDQDTSPDFPASASTVPQGLGYGHQISNDQLNQFIASAALDGRVNEDACYAMAQYGAMRSRYTHGSFTLGLLAGNQPSRSLTGSGQIETTSASPEANLIFVQLPRAVPLAPDRGSVERCTLDGVRYILDSAPDASHIAIVVDYGTEMGPHNGQSWFELALDAMVQEALEHRKITLDIIFPSGNSHNKKRRATIFPDTVGTPISAELQWYLPRGNDAPIATEIWVDANQSGFQLQIFAPDKAGAVITLAADQDGISGYPAGNSPVCVVVSKKFNQQRQILIQLSQTNVSNMPMAVSGVWRLVFTNGNQATGPIDVYTCWQGQNPGMPQRVWPSYFMVHEDHKGHVKISGDGSILGSACGEKTWMVGGYENWPPFKRAQYSSGGQARGGKRKTRIVGADYVAMTEESYVLPGLVCLGTRSADSVRARGTSFAAPQLARFLLLPPGNSRKTPVPTLPVLPRSDQPTIDYAEPRL